MTATTVAAPPAAVLWDMDGTLVDTEPYWIECEHELVDAYGGFWTEDDARSIIGFDLLEAAAVIRERGGVPLEPREIVERLLDGVITRLRHRVPWRPGARRLLTELNTAGVPCALVTMSWSRLAEAVVEALAPITFQAVVTGDGVVHGKPHPEPYLVAAERLGVDPARCVAIEDSPTGIRSATDAGCTVLAIPNIVEIAPAPGRVIVASLKDVQVDDLSGYMATALSGVVPDGVAPVAETDPPASRRDNRRAAVIGGGLIALVVAAAIWVGISGGGDDAPPRRPGALNVHTWTPYWALDDALPELAARADTLHELSPFWFRATGADTIEVEPNTPTDLAAEFMDTARSRDVPLVASILDGTDAGVMAEILADPAQRARHVDAVASFAADGDFAGVDIDYEQFAFADGRDSWAETRPNWVAFVGELSERLHADGRTLTVSIPPVYDAGQTDDSGYWVYDYASIAPLVDNIRVMAYDYSVPSGDAGPIAPLDWVDRVIAGTSAAAGDPSKLVLGIPLYGYNWVVATEGQCPATAEGNISRSQRDMVDLANKRGATPQFDQTNYEMTFTYDLQVSDGATTCTQSREVHYVDANGAQIRMQDAIDGGFRGVSLFALGYEDDDVWRAIDTIAAQIAPVASTPSTPATTVAP
ncbi:MAG: HAD-IA family hydrolase [Ilumatobacteraceae bacterium]